MPIFLINYTINAGDLDKQHRDDNDSDHSSHTIGYIISSDEHSTDFEPSDDEPLSKYVMKRSNSPEFEQEQPTNGAKPRGRGRPCGKMSAKTPESVSMLKVVQQHVCQDRVDEECAHLGIVYKRWEPLNPEQTSHLSVRQMYYGTIIPGKQNIPDWCILCLRNKYLKDDSFGHTHYLRVHHKKLLVVNSSKMLSCKCSEIRSHRSDRSARNQHFHCYICFHPFKAGDLLAMHMITNHTEIDLS